MTDTSPALENEDVNSMRSPVARFEDIQRGSPLLQLGT